MHVLHVLFTHASGGLGQAHVNTTEALIAKGHKVTALMHGQSPYREKITNLGAELKTLEPKGFYDLFAVWQMHKMLKQLQPDLIVAHNARAIALLSMAAKGTSIKICGVTHSYKTKRTSYADVLIVLSEHMKQHFIKSGYNRRIEVIPNLIHLPKSLATHARRTPLVIGAIGRFTIEKGFDVFISALGDLKLAGVNFMARLGGEGEEMAKLKSMAEEYGLTPYIRWEGWIKDQPAFYRELDVICVPSREESFPLVVLEALAHGVPVVASDAHGPVSMLTDGVTGLLVPREDHKALALALKKLADSPELAAGIAEAGWQRVQDFSFDNVAVRWDETLRSIVLTAR